MRAAIRVKPMRFEGAPPAWQHARMSQTYGIETPGSHHSHPEREPVRYVVVIDAGDSTIARLLLATRQQVAEFDAGAPEVVQMLAGIRPAKTANSADWDHVLRGHSALERSAAHVYTLDV